MNLLIIQLLPTAANLAAFVIFTILYIKRLQKRRRENPEDFLGPFLRAGDDGGWETTKSATRSAVIPAYLLTLMTVTSLFVTVAMLLDSGVSPGFNVETLWCYIIFAGMWCIPSVWGYHIVDWIWDVCPE